MGIVDAGALEVYDEVDASCARALKRGADARPANGGETPPNLIALAGDRGQRRRGGAKHRPRAELVAKRLERALVEGSPPLWGGAPKMRADGRQPSM